MATAPVSYQSALIESLRAASPGFGSNNPGVTLLDNPANSKTVINFKRTPIKPYVPPPPAVAPPPPPAPAPAPPPSGGGGPIVIGPGPGPGVAPVSPLPRVDDVPVPDYTDDLWGPETPAPAPNSGGDGAETFPVPDPSPPDVRDLPPLDGPASPVPDYTDDLWPPVYDDIPTGSIEVGPTPSPLRDVINNAPPVTQVDDPLDELGTISVPEPVIDPPFIPPPAVQDDSAPLPDYTDDLWPPVYDEIPQGEIEVGPPGNSQPARDAINNAPPVTQVDDPLTELGTISVPEPVIDPPFIPPAEDITPPVYDEIPQGEIEIVAPGNSQPARDAINDAGPVTDVGDPLDHWDWIEADAPEITVPEFVDTFDPINLDDFFIPDVDWFDMLFGDFGGWSGGGGGGRGWDPLIMME